MRHSMEPEYLKRLNESQRKAVLHEGSPLLILAGAGSGKTRVITTKIAYLIDCLGVDPRSILAVTFTNKAAREMEERVFSLTPLARGVMIRTFHSFGAWFLRRNAAQAGLVAGFSIYDDDDSLSLLSDLKTGKTKKELSPYQKAIARAKDAGLLPEDSAKQSPLPRFAEIYAEYQEKLRKTGNVDFGDLLLLPVEVLRANRDILDRLCGRFSVILVDEYQDSNTIQFQLLKLLASRGAYIAVVGDDDQSIYSFRGAEVDNILSFSKSFPGTTLLRLEQNYRSTPEILKVASSVISNNSGRLGKTLWTDLPSGKRVRLIFCEDQEEEALICARLIREEPSLETAILYRTNAQSLPFETLFNRLRIPFRLVGALRFYEREEVKDLLSYLSLLVNPLDEVAFKRIVNKPTRGIGKSTQEKILVRAREYNLDLPNAALEIAKEGSSKTGDKIRSFVSLMEKFSGLVPKLPLYQLIKVVMEDSGLYEYYNSLDSITARQKIDNLQELISSSSSYDAGLESLVRFMENSTLDRSSRQEGFGEDARVSLITMHNTKGLEFERVIITGLEEGTFPGWEGSSNENIEEERRLFYVSVTRAKQELYLISCRRRLRWGRFSSLHPSRFISEIEKGLIEVEGEASGEEEQYPLGMAVFHESYGAGIIVERISRGNDFAVKVRFESGRTAQIIPKYQKLERISWDD